MSSLYWTFTVIRIFKPRRKRVRHVTRTAEIINTKFRSQNKGKRSLGIPILSQKNPGHTFPYFFQTHFHILPSTPRSSKRFPSQGFSIKTLDSCYAHSCAFSKQLMRHETHVHPWKKYAQGLRNIDSLLRLYKASGTRLYTHQDNMRANLISMP